MFVRELGVGPVVVLLHGTPSPPQDLLPLATELARRYRVLIPDLPGYGQTAALEELTVERYADTIAAMLATQGVTRVRAVVGFACGAYIALDLVSRGLVAADLVISLAGAATFDDAGRTFRRELARAIRLDPSTITRELDALMPTLMLSPAWRASHPEDDARTASWLHLTSPHVMADELAAAAELRDLRPELPALRSRLYLRVGELDVACPPACSVEMARLAPRATLDIVPGCGHALLIEDAPATIAAIAAQLDADLGG